MIDTIVSFFFWIFQVPLMYNTFFPCLVCYFTIKLVYFFLGGYEEGKL